MTQEDGAMAEKSGAKLILASASPFRAQLMRNAGLEFVVVRPEIDERAVEASLGDSDISGADLAEILAIAKARNVSESNPYAVVTGCDQTLNLGDEILHKPQSIDEVRRRLLQLSGRTHDLNSAICLVSQGETIWSHVSTCHITFRKLDPGFVGRYVAEAGDAVLSSVGAYQIEGTGIQLIERIEGDFFSIMGLPLLALLEKLREHDLIDQ